MSVRKHKKKILSLFALAISSLFVFGAIETNNAVGNQYVPTNADITTTGWVSADGGQTAISATDTGISCTLAGWGYRIRTAKTVAIDGLTFDLTLTLDTSSESNRGGFYFSSSSSAYPNTGSYNGPIVTLVNKTSWSQTRIGIQTKHSFNNAEIPGTENLAYESATGDTKFSNTQANDGSAVLNVSATQKLRFSFKSVNDDRYEMSVHELEASKIWGTNPNFGKSDLTDNYCFRAYINKSSFGTASDGAYYMMLYGYNNTSATIENVHFNAAYKEVIDGAVGSDVKYAQVSSGTTPVNVSKYGYTFGGWYSDSSLTTPLTKIEDSQTVVYAKFTSILTKTYSFDTNQSNFNNEDTYLYCFDSSGGENAPWPGVQLSMANGVSGSVAVPNNATIIVNNGSDKQSNNITQTGLDNDICYIVYKDSANTGYWGSNNCYYVLGNNAFNQTISHSGTWGDGGNLKMGTALGTDKAYLEFTTENNNVEIRVAKGNNAGYDWLDASNYEGILISKSGDNIKLQKGSYKLFVNSEDVLYVSATVETVSSQLTRMLRANCDATGEKSDLLGIKHIWANVVKDYNTIQTDAEKALLAEADENSEAVYKDAAKLYDLIYSKYSTSLSLNDFLGRFAQDSSVETFYSLNLGSSQLSNSSSSSANQATMLSITIVSCLSLIGLLGIVIFKIRKNTKNSDK